MYRCIFEERIELEQGKLVRITNARWNGKRYGSGNMDVFKLYEDGRKCCRNLCFCIIGGYMLEEIEDPDEVWCEPRIECKSFVEGFGNIIDDEEVQLIKDKYPDFRWMLDKCRNYCGSIAFIWEALAAWKLWPECERLVNGGFYKLAMSSGFAKLPYLQQQKIAEWLKRNPGSDYGLGKIQTMMSKNLTSEEYDLMKRRVSMDCIKYFGTQVKKGLFETLLKTSRIYDDYIIMAKSLNHDTESDYWKFPNDLVKAHEKVLDENARKEAARQKEKMSRYRRAVERFLPKKLDYEGLTVYVPENYETIDGHARALHQCLTYTDYIGKVSDGKCLLVFIKCGDTPKATAEILPDGKVGQFYGDEKDRDNCQPGEAEKRAMDVWMKTFKPRIRKVKEAA